MKSVSKNYIYNLSYQILIIITPLITTPYVSRVLGADGIGSYSYTQSIVNYFILFGTLGLSMYGQREIASRQDDRRQRSILFYEIILVRFITIAISLTVFVLAMLGDNPYRMLYAIQLIDIVAACVDVSWFFQGTEDFKLTVIRNAAVRIICLICIFVFVRTAEDLNIYVLIHSLTTIAGHLSLWFYLPRYIEKVPVKELRLVRHIVPAVSVFIPQVAIRVYTVLDKSMIGWITKSSFENGYFEQAYKVEYLLQLVVTSLGVVVASRIAYLHSQKNVSDIKKYMMRSFNLVWLIGLPMMFGMIAVADHFVPWFFGDGYDKCIPLLKVFSALLIAIGLSNVIGVQYLVPTNRQNEFTLAVTAGAVSNVCLNLLLIPKFQSVGAAAASVVAETIVTAVMFICIRRLLRIGQVFCLAVKKLIAAAVMFVVVWWLGTLLDATIPGTALMVICGAAVYFGLLFAMRDAFFLEAAGIVMTRLKKAAVAVCRP